MAEIEESSKDMQGASLPKADRDFENAVRYHDFACIKAALLAGADPNRIFNTSSSWPWQKTRKAHRGLATRAGEQQKCRASAEKDFLRLLNKASLVPPPAAPESSPSKPRRSL